MSDRDLATGHEPIRVLMLIDRLVNPSGAERFAIGLSAELVNQGFEVTMCATRGASDAVARSLQESGVPLIVLGRTSTLDVLPFLRLLRLLRSRRIDVLHAHMFGSSVWAAFLGRLARVPVVLAHEHGTFVESRVRQLAYGGVVGRLITRYVAVSEAARERMISDHAIARSQTVVIPAAYIPRPQEPTRDLRAEAGIPSTAKVIGTVATMRPIKALDVLVSAHAVLAATHPGAHLLLVGDGPSRGELEAQAAELGAGDRVHFVGIREDIASVLGSLDVGALSSDSEGTPLFVLECMAFGVPVVSTDVGGLRDLVVPDVSALLVPPRDPEALAAALASLLDDPALGRRLALAAQERIPEFTLAAISARFAELYRSLLEDGESATRERRRRPRAPARA